MWPLRWLKGLGAQSRAMPEAVESEYTGTCMGKVRKEVEGEMPHANHMCGRGHSRYMLLYTNQTAAFIATWNSESRLVYRVPARLETTCC